MCLSAPKTKKLTCVIGPNGAGKSTVLKATFGFLKPWLGKILHRDQDVAGFNPSEMLKRGMTYLLQSKAVFPRMTVEENLQMGCWLIKKEQQKVKDSLSRIYNEYPMLYETRKSKAGTLSGGQQRLLELARSMMTDPETILLDEPTAGLAPKVAKQVYDRIEGLKDKGYTILMVDQNVRTAVSLADYVYVLELGKNTREGPKAEIGRDLESLIRSWL